MTERIFFHIRNPGCDSVEAVDITEEKMRFSSMGFVVLFLNDKKIPRNVWDVRTTLTRQLGDHVRLGNGAEQTSTKASVRPQALWNLHQSPSY